MRILGLAGIVNGRPAGGVNIIGGDLFLEGGNTGGIGTSLLPIVDRPGPAALLEEANAELSVCISEVNGDLNLVTAFSATGDVDLTAAGSILNGNTFNDMNVDARRSLYLFAGDNIGSASSPLMTDDRATSRLRPPPAASGWSTMVRLTASTACKRGALSTSPR